ncbi:tape measure protein [Porphyromonas sp.]
MANNLSFSVRLELLAEKFKQQAESAKGALRGIQFQAIAMAGALGAGVTSLSGLLSSLVNTAREAGRSRTILRNVSTDAREYARSLKFLTDLTDKYGTDLIGTTEAFAKFKAAATPAGIALAEQERIFSNMSKAMASFGISGGEASLTMTAITQMMGKGKISSEELRQQLGERMPIAMQAMANAAGVSMAQLDKLLKEGKLRSADIMGKFSDELARLSGDTNTDNLESSLGRLKNAFTDLADSLHIYDNFKALVDKVKEALDYIKTHLSNLYIWAGGLLAVKLWNKFAGAWSQAGAMIKTASAGATADEANAKARADRATAKAQKALDEAEAKLQRAEAALAQAQAPTASETHRLHQMQTLSQGRIDRLDANIGDLQAHRDYLLREHQAFLRSLQRSEAEAANRIVSARTALAESGGNDAARRKELQRAIEYQAKLQAQREQAEARLSNRLDENSRKLQRLQLQRDQAVHDQKEALANAHARNEEARIKRTASLQAGVDKASRDVDSKRTALASVASGGSAVVADQTSAASSTLSIWTRCTTSLKLLWGSTVATIRGMMATIAPMAIIAGITAIITALVDWYRKEKEINNLQSEYLAKQKEIQTTKSDEAVQIERLFSLYKSLDGQLEKQKTVQHQLEQSLGLQEGSLDRIAGKYDQIRNLVNKILQLKQIERQIDFYSETAKENRKPLQDSYATYLKNGGKSISGEEVDRVGKVLGKYASLNDAQRDKYLKGAWYDSSVHTSTDNQRELTKLKGIYKEIFGADASKEAKRFIVSILEEGWTYQTLRGVAGSQLVAGDAEEKLKQYQLQQIKVNESVTEEVHKNGGKLAGEGTGAPTTSDDDKKKGKKSELQRTREQAAHELKELENQRKAGILSEEEYRTALDKVAQRYREKLAGLLGEKALLDKQYKDLEKHIIAEREIAEEKAKSAAELKVVSAQVRYGLATEEDLRNAKAERAKAELNTIIKMRGELDTNDEYVRAKLDEIDAASSIASLQRSYAKDLQKLASERDKGLKTEKEYNDALTQLIASTRERATSTATPTQGQESIKNELNRQLTSDSSSIIPKRTERDTTFDYKKDELAKLGEEKQLLDEYVRGLKEAERAGADVAEALKKAQKETKTLDQAIKVATLQSDLKKFQEALSNKTFEGVKSVAQSARNLKSAFDGLQKAFDPESNASAWERFFAVFDSATQVIDTILSMQKMIEGLTEAQKIASVTEQALMKEKIVTRTAVTATEATSTSTEIGLSSSRVAATSTETSADTVGAAAKAAKANAGIPIIGIALAAAAVAGIIALITSSANKVPKFANGGIVPGGDGSGDRVHAMVNPGELILNKAQQGRLANHLTSSSALRVEVEGRIRAKDILELTTTAIRHKNR